ncbi:MAG: putative sensor histidine kinase TcrY [Pelotomaculum sp. PtaU1.Bin035]|nr:MAG: putative sensor histidine kinase TcrY [Pelotomaculum sp. PtaU1.Bin035]
MKFPQYIHSLRARLTLGLLLVLTVLLLVYGLLAYTELKADLIETAEAKLRVQVGPTLKRWASHNYTVGENQHPPVAGLIQELEAQGLDVLIYDKEGNPLASSSQAMEETLSLPSSLLSEVLKGTDQIRVQPGAEGRKLVYLVPVIGSGGEVQGALEVSASMTNVDVSLSRARLLLFAGGFLVLLAAVGLVCLVIRFALRPLTNLAATARSISGNGLTSRVVVPPGGDEITELFVAFNSMLDQLENAFAAQRKATDQVRQFAADASHELRSYLTVITGYLDVLRRGAASEPQEQTRVLTAARTELERLSRLVDDLLTLARLGAGAPLRRQALDVTGLLSDAAQRAILLAPGRRVTVRCPALPPLLADPDRMRQVLNNLVDNALRHTALEEEITLGAEVRNESLCMWVHNTGTVIAAENLSRVFERFWRADSSRSCSKGSGLGLAIVAAIAEAHGGTVDVYSASGSGTTFTVCLPLNVRENS